SPNRRASTNLGNNRPTPLIFRFSRIQFPPASCGPLNPRDNHRGLAFAFLGRFSLSPVSRSCGRRSPLEKPRCGDFCNPVEASIGRKGGRPRPPISEPPKRVVRDRL